MSKNNPEVIGVDMAEPGSDYTVVTPVDSGGKLYPPGSTITLPDDQADYPLSIGAIKHKAAE